MNSSSMCCSAAESIVTTAIAAVDPGAAIRRHVRYSSDLLWCGSNSFELNREVIVVAFGKASYSMAASVVDILPESTRVKGIVIAKDGHEPTPREQKVLESFTLRDAAHPVPDERNVQASQEVMDMVEKSLLDQDQQQKPLLIACISGGGSALFCTPLPGISLEDLRATHTALLNSGLSIQQMNVIRKRLESGKGGGLQADVALILSDIIGDPLDLIASGPTVVTSIDDDDEGLQSSLLSLDLPDSVKDVLSRPPQQQQQSNRCVNHLVGNNSAAVQAAAEQAKTLGYDPVILSTEMEGEASTVGHMMAVMAKQVQKQSLYGIRNKLPVALIAGGETTVTLPSTPHGLGGRNQELALAAAVTLQDHPGIVIASVGTDGTDGPTDAAGAIVDSTTIATSSEAVLALAQHDAYHYLAKAKRSDGKFALYKTGPTGTNVADVIVALVHNADD